MANYNVFLQLHGDQGAEPGSSAEVFDGGLADRLRRFHHDFPEFEMWQIEWVHGNNVYSIKLGHLHHGYVRAISYDPTDFDVMDWVVVGFYRGNRNDPFILAQGTVGEQEPEPIEILAGWYCEQADFRRSQSNLRTNFAPDTFVKATTPSGGRYHRQLEDYRAKVIGGKIGIPRTPGDNSSVAWWDPAVRIEEMFGLADGRYEDNGEWEPLEDNQTRTHSLDYAQEERTSIVGDLVYITIEFSIETLTETVEDEGTEDEYIDDYYDYRDYTYLFVLTADPPVTTVEEVWHLNLDFPVEGTIASLAENADVVVTGGRAAVAYWQYYPPGSGANFPAIIHVDALTGLDPQVISLEDVRRDNILSSPSISRIDYARAMEIFAVGDSRIWYGGTISGRGLTCVDLATNSIVWTQAEASEANSNLALHPLGFAGDSLICTYSEADYETIKDYEISLSIPFTGGLVGKARQPAFARGHSNRSGIMAINPSTGAEIGRTMFAGQESAGVLELSRTDYLEKFHEENYVDNITSAKRVPAEAVDRNLWPYPYYDTSAYPHPEWSGHGTNYLPSTFSYCKFVNPINIFYGALPHPTWQDENFTKTYVEGEADSTGVGLFDGFFDIIKPGASPSPVNPSDSWENQRDTKAINKQWGRLQGYVPGNPTPARPFPAENTLVAAERSRRENGDWARAMVTHIEMEDVALFDDSRLSFPLMSEDGAADSIALSTWDLIERSYKENGESLSTIVNGAKPLVYTPGVEAIPSYTPGIGAALSQDISLEYRHWHENRQDGDLDPWDGVASVGEAKANREGGQPNRVTQSIVWRQGSGETVPRTRTPAPPLRLGPTASTGPLLILGPNDASTDMTWVAINSSGQVEWSTTVAKDGFPGSPLVIGLAGQVAGIFTPYSLDGVQRYVILNGATGAVMWDDVQPLAGAYPDRLSEAQVIDNTIWELMGSSYGIENLGGNSE